MLWILSERPICPSKSDRRETLVGQCGEDDWHYKKLSEAMRQEFDS